MPEDMNNRRDISVAFFMGVFFNIKFILRSSLSMI
jgi:hypothetical protein